MMNKYFFTALCLLCCTIANAKIKLPQLIKDHMVLQQQTNARLWGEATPNSIITIKASWAANRPIKTKADAQGYWETAIATPKASFTPQTLTISDGTPIKINDILIGEVWLCSGQSNMEMPLRGFDRCPIFDSNNFLADAPNHPAIRAVTLAHANALTPQRYIDGGWSYPTSENAQIFSATGYFFALALQRFLQVPIGIIGCSWGGSALEGWLPKEILKDYKDIDLSIIVEKDIDHLYPMVMYNSLLYPCKNYTIKGFLWYQGCSNVGKADTYAERQATMVKEWRKLWREGDIPFYYVEIAPFDYNDVKGINAALLREAQFKAQSLVPNSAIVSTNDLVEPYESSQIHPRDKKDVGERLALQALVKTYGRKGIVSDSPSYKEMQIKGDEIIIKFNHADKGFNRMVDIQGFEIAGADKIFHPANVKLNNEINEIVVFSEEVNNPVAVRYCFHNFQLGNLKSQQNLPVIPFRTDNW